MESRKTKILLDKYWAGQTTVEEEELLSSQVRDGRSKEDQKYSLIFDYKDHLLKDETETFDLSFLSEVKPGKVKLLDATNNANWKKWAMGLAASIMVAIGSVTYQWPHTQTLEAKAIQMENAYTETLAALQLVADKLNKGNESIREISVFDKTTKHITYEN